MDNIFFINKYKVTKVSFIFIDDNNNIYLRKNKNNEYNLFMTNYDYKDCDILNTLYRLYNEVLYYSNTISINKFMKILKNSEYIYITDDNFKNTKILNYFLNVNIFNINFDNFAIYRNNVLNNMVELEKYIKNINVNYIFNYTEIIKFNINDLHKYYVNFNYYLKKFIQNYDKYKLLLKINL